MDRTVRVYDVATGRERVCIDTPSGVWGVAVSPDGREVLSSGVDGSVRLNRLPVEPPR